MKDFLMWTLAIIIGVTMFIAATGYNNDKRSKRLYAKASVIRAQSQSRMDLASAVMPYVVIVAITVAGGVVLAVVAVAFAKVPPAQPGRTEHVERVERERIEIRTIILLQPGQHSRREVFKLLGGGHNEPQIIERELKQGGYYDS